MLKTSRFFQIDISYFETQYLIPYLMILYLSLSVQQTWCHTLYIRMRAVNVNIQ